MSREILSGLIAIVEPQESQVIKQNCLCPLFDQFLKQFLKLTCKYFSLFVIQLPVAAKVFN